jgi:hypothetical protein
MNDTPNLSGVLIALIGQQLSSVTFVQDYRRLDFDGKRLTINAWPRLILEEREFRIGDTGYRDAVCSLIGNKVLSTQETTSDITI